MPKLKTKTLTVIDSCEWDRVVWETYGKPYCLQQQSGCYPKGTMLGIEPEWEGIEITSEDPFTDNMGTPFKDWLDRKPEERLPHTSYDWKTNLWWERNFYPDLDVLAHDLYKKGLIGDGAYTILIDW